MNKKTDQYDLVDALVQRARELGWIPVPAETAPGSVILTFREGRSPFHMLLLVVCVVLAFLIPGIILLFSNWRHVR